MWVIVCRRLCAGCSVLVVGCCVMFVCWLGVLFAVVCVLVIVRWLLVVVLLVGWCWCVAVWVCCRLVVVCVMFAGGWCCWVWLLVVGVAVLFVVTDVLSVCWLLLCGNGVRGC